MMVRQFIVSGILLGVGNRQRAVGKLGTLDGRTIFFFGLSGICGGAAGLWTYYHALRLGGASLVVPITATYPLITVHIELVDIAGGFNDSPYDRDSFDCPGGVDGEVKRMKYEV